MLIIHIKPSKITKEYINCLLTCTNFKRVN